MHPPSAQIWIPPPPHTHVQILNKKVTACVHSSVYCCKSRGETLLIKRLLGTFQFSVQQHLSFVGLRNSLGLSWMSVSWIAELPRNFYLFRIVFQISTFILDTTIMWYSYWSFKAGWALKVLVDILSVSVSNMCRMQMLAAVFSRMPLQQQRWSHLPTYIFNNIDGWTQRLNWAAPPVSWCFFLTSEGIKMWFYYFFED